MRCCQLENAVQGGLPISTDSFSLSRSALDFSRMSALVKSHAWPLSSSPDKSNANPGTSSRLGISFKALVTRGALASATIRCMAWRLLRL